MLKIRRISKEPVEQDKPTKHKLSGIIGSIVTFILLVAICTTAYMFRASLSIVGFFSALNNCTTLTLSHGEVISSTEVDSGLVKDFKPLLGGLVVLGPDNVIFYDIHGNQRFKYQLSYSDPVISTSQNFCMVYDRGGTSFAVFNGYKPVLEAKTETPILSAFINSDGYFTITSNDTGYRAVVSLFNKKGHTLYKWYTSSYYVSRSCVSPENTDFFAICMSEENGSFISSLMIFNIKEEAPVAQVNLGNEYVLNASYLDFETLCIVTETHVLFYSKTGQKLADVPLEGVFYANIAKENSLPITAVSGYLAGSFQLQILNSDGSVRSECTTTGNLQHISSFGDYLSVATDDTIYILDKNLQELYEPLSIGGAKGLYAISHGIIAIFHNNTLQFIKL